MRILHLRASAGAYGAERVIETLAREQLAQGLEAEVACLEPGGVSSFSRNLGAAGIPVHRVRDGGRLDAMTPLRVLALVRRLRPDVLHSHGYKTDVIAAVLAPLRARPRLVATNHLWTGETRAVRWYERLDAAALRTLDVVVAVSGAIQAELLAAGVSPGRVVVIPNGITLPAFPQGPPSLAEELRLPRGAPLVGFVGRLSPQKNVAGLLDAAGSGMLADVHFALVGDGPLRAELAVTIARRGLERRVHLLGWRADVASVLPALDALVLPSHREGTPLVVLEAMAAARTVIATRVGGIPDLVQDGRTGMLVPPGDPAALAQAVRRALDDPELRRRMGEAARAAVRSRFSAAGMARRYLSAYRGDDAARSPAAAWLEDDR